MDKLFTCIDTHLQELQTQMLAIVDDQSIPLAEKNKLMEPIVDTKKVLLETKAALQKIQNKEYVAGCGMHKLR